MSPYPPGTPFWELMNYLQANMGMDPSWHAFVRAAVVTSPLNIVAVDVETDKDRCSPMPTIAKRDPVTPQDFVVNITAKIVNQGQTAQNFTVTAYVNSTVMGTTTVNDLAPGTNASVVVATWNTTEWAYGNYSLTVATSASYQSWTSKFLVNVVLAGDVNGDGTANILDGIKISNSWNKHRGEPDFNPNADINCDDVVNILDGIILSNHWNQSPP
jgi:hypothetical protein